MSKFHPFLKLSRDFSLIDEDIANKIIEVLNVIRKRQNNALKINEIHLHKEIDTLFRSFFLSTKKRTKLLTLASKLLPENFLTNEERQIVLDLQDYGCIEQIQLEEKTVLLVSPEGLALLEALRSAQHIGANLAIDVLNLEEALSLIEVEYRNQGRNAIKRLERSLRRRTLSAQQVGALILLLLLGVVGKENKIENLDSMREEFKGFVVDFHSLVGIKAENLDKWIFRGESLSNFLSHSGFDIDYSIYVRESTIYIKREKVEQLIDRIITFLRKNHYSEKFWKIWPNLRNKSIEIRVKASNLSDRKFDSSWDSLLTTRFRNALFLGDNSNVSK